MAIDTFLFKNLNLHPNCTYCATMPNEINSWANKWAGGKDFVRRPIPFCFNKFQRDGTAHTWPRDPFLFKNLNLHRNFTSCSDAEWNKWHRLAGKRAGIKDFVRRSIPISKSWRCAHMVKRYFFFKNLNLHLNLHLNQMQQCQVKGTVGQTSGKDFVRHPIPICFNKFQRAGAAHTWVIF